MPRDRAAPAIPRVLFRNPAQPGLSIEVLALSDLRRKAPAGYLDRPQRPAFHLLLVPTRGACVHEIDFERVRLSAGSVAWIRPGQVQRFDPGREVEGWLVLFTDELLARGVEAPLGPRIDVGAVAEEVTWLVDRLRRFSQERGADGEATRSLLHHLLHALLALLRRCAAAGGAPEAGSVFALFRAEVERRFAQTRALQEYARVIGYSPKTLTRATQAAAGISAKAYIDQRVLLEGRRLLAYTELGTSEIASRLGFSEATNFIKFFRRGASESPTAFRARATGSIRARQRARG